MKPKKISHRAVHGSLYQDERHEDRQKHVLKEYPKQALECYKLVDVYRDFRADTKPGCESTKIENFGK